VPSKESDKRMSGVVAHMRICALAPGRTFVAASMSMRQSHNEAEATMIFSSCIPVEQPACQIEWVNVTQRDGKRIALERRYSLGSGKLSPPEPPLYLLVEGAARLDEWSRAAVLRCKIFSDIGSIACRSGGTKMAHLGRPSRRAALEG
jgi:predicted metal-binding protein